MFVLQIKKWHPVNLGMLWYVLWVLSKVTLVLLWFYIDWPRFTQIYLNLPQFTTIYIDLPWFISSYFNLPQFTSVNPNLRKTWLACWIYSGAPQLWELLAELTNALGPLHLGAFGQCARRKTHDREKSNKSKQCHLVSSQAGNLREHLETCARVAIISMLNKLAHIVFVIVIEMSNLNRIKGAN